MIELSMLTAGANKILRVTGDNKPFVELLQAICTIRGSGGVALSTKRVNSTQLIIAFHKPWAIATTLIWISRMLEVGSREFFEAELVRIKRDSRVFSKRYR